MSGRTSGFRRRFLAAGLLVGVLAIPLTTRAVVTPLVKLTLTASPNPASDLASMVLTITVTPVNGTIPAIEVGLEGKGGGMCTPAPNCFYTFNGLPHWTFTNFSTPMTGTVTTNGGTGGSDIRLYIYSEGVGCVGACPARLHQVFPVAGIRLTYTGPTPVVSGSVLHFTMTGTANAWPMGTTLQAEFPAGLDDPTGVEPSGYVWDPGSRRIESYQIMDKVAVVTFDAVVSAANGTTINVIARTFPGGSVWSNQQTVPIAVGSQTPPDPVVERLYGSDRYSTAAAISRRTLGSTTFAAFIATGANYPDALVAGPAAFSLGGPVLLVTKNAIPASVKTELSRILPSRIFILGGTSTISSTVQTQLAAYSYNPVIRLDGTNRYDTGAKVMQYAFGGYTGPVFLATGVNFPDALSGGPAAAQFGAPIVLSGRDALPSRSLDSLADTTPSKFILLGGSSVLSSALITYLAAHFPGVPVERWSGSDRYSTSAVISSKAFPDGAGTVFLAIGTNYPDALSGGYAAADSAGPILLTKATCLPAPIFAELQRLNPSRIVLLGGPSVLHDSVVTTQCAP